LEINRQDYPTQRELAVLPNGCTLNQITLSIYSRVEIFWFRYLPLELDMALAGFFNYNNVEGIEWNGFPNNLKFSINGSFEGYLGFMDSRREVKYTVR